MKNIYYYIIGLIILFIGFGWNINKILYCIGYIIGEIIYLIIYCLACIMLWGQNFYEILQKFLKFEKILDFITYPFVKIIETIFDTLLCKLHVLKECK